MIDLPIATTVVRTHKNSWHSGLHAQPLFCPKAGGGFYLIFVFFGPVATETLEHARLQ